jgi:hypothetical protein
MHKTRGETESDIDYYAGSNVTAGALALLQHPVIHSVRLSNHRFAEGIDVEPKPESEPFADDRDDEASS